MSLQNTENIFWIKSQDTDQYIYRIQFKANLDQIKKNRF